MSTCRDIRVVGPANGGGSCWDSRCDPSEVSVSLDSPRPRPRSGRALSRRGGPPPTPRADAGAPYLFPTEEPAHNVPVTCIPEQGRPSSTRKIELLIYGTEERSEAPTLKESVRVLPGSPGRANLGTGRRAFCWSEGSRGADNLRTQRVRLTRLFSQRATLGPRANDTVRT